MPTASPRHSQQDPHQPHQGRHHPILHFMHDRDDFLKAADKRVGQADLAVQAGVMVAGKEAFRNYAALANRIGVNKAGNLRGMVVSARWRTIFQHISDVGEYTENLGYLAAISAGVAEQAPRIEEILNGQGDPVVKGLQVAGIAGTVAERALLGVIPTGTHLIYRSLEGWCMIAGLPGGKMGSASSEGIKILQSADALVQTTFNQVTDTDNQSKAFWFVVSAVTSPRH